MTTIASATPGASRVPKADVTGKLLAGWFSAAVLLTDLGLGAGVAGDLVYGSGANTLARLGIGTAGRILVSSGTAPAWSDSGLSYASGVLTVAGSVPGTPAAGQVFVGGGVIKAGGAISGASLTASGLTSGRVVLGGVGGLLGDSSALTFSVGSGLTSSTGITASASSSATASILTALTVNANCTGTAAAGFGIQHLYSASTDTTANVALGAVRGTWVNATHATRRGRLSFYVWDAANTREGFAIETDGATANAYVPGALTCTGVVTGANGTAGAPGLRLAGSASGLYYVTASVLGISVNGAATFKVYTPNGSTYGGAIALNSPSAAEGAIIFNETATSFCTYSGGSSINLGGWTKAYGQTHATKPNYVEFGHTSTVSAYFDGSGKLTCNGVVAITSTTTAGVASGALVCSGGGYFAKAVFANNDASGVHYYGNSGLTMRDVGTGTSTYLDLAFGSASHGAYNIRSSNAATVRFNIDTSGHVTLGGAAGNYLNINNATGELRVNGAKVVSARNTGWTAQTASASKTDLGAAPTVGALASFCRSLYDALAGHGLIGA